MNRLLSGIPGVYREWKAVLAQRDRHEQRFDQWLFINAAGVLLGEKTGELLSLSLDELAMTKDSLEDCLSGRAQEWGFRYKILNASPLSQKMLIYDRDRLESVLADLPGCIMHGKLGYPSPLSADAFLDEVGRRWAEKGEIPHEVGLALGYPQDDVFGYMGLLPLPCLGLCGWQVYGCMREARRRSCAFQDARCRALAFLAA